VNGNDDDAEFDPTKPEEDFIDDPSDEPNDEENIEEEDFEEEGEEEEDSAPKKSRKRKRRSTAGKSKKKQKQFKSTRLLQLRELAKAAQMAGPALYKVLAKKSEAEQIKHLENAFEEKDIDHKSLSKQKN